jgi:hypothetical protein
MCGPGDRSLDAAKSPYLRMKVRNNAGSERRIPLMLVCYDQNVIGDRTESFNHETKHGPPA